jgi:hypothetical protein
MLPPQHPSAITSSKKTALMQCLQEYRDAAIRALSDPGFCKTSKIYQMPHRTPQMPQQM